MFKFIMNLFRKKEWRNICTIKYRFQNKQNSSDIAYVSATFKITKDNERAVDLDYDRSVFFYGRPKNHPFYHNFCVPFLKKTGDYELDWKAESTLQYLAKICKTPEEQMFETFRDFENNPKDFLNQYLGRGLRPEMEVSISEIVDDAIEGKDTEKTTGSVIQFPRKEDL